ncbi:MAG: hypothetical protein M3331_04745 [Actinomycetota bacterium]|nr:hypothetical protein [Actinomycetota bacterium]
MTISADQSAVLEMLLSSGQSYDDLDDLFGLDEGGTRERARAALTELGGADPDRNVALTDYLLGQADPIGRADAVRHLRQDASDRDLAGGILTELETLYPAAELPKLPQAPPGGRFGGRAGAAPSQPSGAPKAPRMPRTNLTPKQTRTFAAMGAGAIVLIAVVLAIAGVFSGDGETESTSLPEGDELATNDTGETTDPSTPIPDGEEISRIALAPPGGGQEGGAAVVGLTDTDQPYLDLVLSNVEEAPKDQAYIVWFMFDEDNGYPLPAPIAPTGKTFEGRFPIPVEAASAVARARAIEVSLSKPDDVLQAVQAAAEANTVAIERPGTTIVRGDVPREAANPPTEEQPAPGEGGQGG